GHVTSCLRDPTCRAEPCRTHGHHPCRLPPVRPGEGNCYSQQNRYRRNPEKHFHSAIHRNLLVERECLLNQLVSVATSPLHPSSRSDKEKGYTHWPGGAKIQNRHNRSTGQCFAPQNCDHRHRLPPTGQCANL